MDQKILPIQQSFSSGEITPRARQRSDLDGYHVGSQTQENFLSWIHGPAARRDGFRYTSRVPGDNGRLIPFESSLFVTFMIAITPISVYVHDLTGTYFSGVENSNVDFLDEGLNWLTDTGTQSYIAFGRGAALLSPGTHHNGYVKIWQQSNVLLPGEEYGAYVTPIGGDAPITVRVGTAEHGSDIFVGDYTSDQPIFFSIGTGHSTALWLELEVGPSEHGRDIDFMSIVNIGEGALSFPSPWDSADKIRELQWDMPPGDDYMIICQQSTPQQILSYNTDTRLWTLGDVSYTNPPAEWTGTNYPGCITFHEGRMWHGRTPARGEAFWASVSGQYLNFDLGSGLDADAISFSIDRRGDICWMAGLKDLIIGTERSEYIVKSSAGVITASDISVEAQTHHGSAFLQPALVGNTVVFVNKDYKKVREMHYSWTDGGWISEEISYMAEHIPRNDPIIEISFAQNPESLIWFRTSTGKLVACTFDPEKKLVGWHRHPTEGVVLSAAVLNEAGQAFIWILSKRNPDADYLTLERQNPNVFMDSFAFVQYQTPSDVLPDADWLADMTVKVTVDGAVHPDVTLDENGGGTLEYAGYSIYYGLSYNSKLIPMPLDKGTTMGSAQSLTKRWNRIYVSILDSALPTINGKRPPTRHYSTPMDTPEPLITQDVKVSNLGWDREAQVTIEMDLPLPCNITGIFGEVSQNYISK